MTLKSNPSGSNPAENKYAEIPTKSNVLEIPRISLPKGGGALKGIDEKFQVNGATGTATFSISFPFSSNRNGFTPQLLLSYNSGLGNSIFGIGWEAVLPAISRQTDKKLPRYYDTNDVRSIPAEDTFMFTGVEELVPMMEFKNGKWDYIQFRDASQRFTIRQYRPRIEGGFSRIERIHDPDNGYYWKVTTGNNITTFFGYSKNCRITDPANSEKIYSWLPEFSFDNKGSWIWYDYKEENLDQIKNDVHEKNRFAKLALFSNRHLKRIKYGNTEPYIPDKERAYECQLPQNTNHHFECILDYGEHNSQAPLTTDTEQWNVRPDAFSTFRPGFEMRTYRLCRRILMFHTFPALNGGSPTLVRSLDLDYEPSSAQKAEKLQPCELTYLVGITQKGYIRKPDGSYSSKDLPRMTFDYQWLKWDKEIKEVSKEDLIHAPTGLSGPYQWVDLYSEGISGILSEQANGWFYKSNLGINEHGEVQFEHARAIPKPSYTGLTKGVLQLQDLEGNGQKQVVVTSPDSQGYFELDETAEWQPFKAFAGTINIDLRDPNVRMLDVNGDGRPEVLLSEQGAFWWWENLGKAGYDSPELAIRSYDEEKGPVMLFSDRENRIFFADFNGDGMPDIVRICNGEICYWPNKGYGYFGAKITMSNSPFFDKPEQFNPAYLKLADISGTGATDIIYTGKNKFSAFLNFSGNAWSDATEIDPFFPTELPNNITVTDLLGIGTACLVWSSELPAYKHASMRYIDLMGGLKPHIMKSYENGMGKRTDVQYKSSTYYYLKDRKDGMPWVTRLAFPVQCVSKTVVTEKVTGVRFTAEYSYHHGYYDHVEREFRGFGRVDQLDTEYFETFEKSGASNVVPKELHQAPVLTRTWFHTGSFHDKEKILSQFKKEYWYEEFRKKGFEVTPVEYELPDARLVAAHTAGNFDTGLLSAEEWREALRACKGMTLRQEIFALDAQDPADTEELKKQFVPYSVLTHTCEIQLLQPRKFNKYGIFIVNESEAITWQYERNPDDPRIAHTLNISTDEMGNVLESASVVYPRFGAEDLLKDVPADNLAARNAKIQARKAQQKCWITFTKNAFTNEINLADGYLHRKKWETKTYELTGLKSSGRLFSLKDFENGFDNWKEIEYHFPSTEGLQQKRLIEHIKTTYYNDALTDPMAEGVLGKTGIACENFQLAYTPNLLQDLFTPSAMSAQFEVTETDMLNARYVQVDTNWWIRSGTIQYRRTGETFEDIVNRFFAPVAFTDPFDSITEVFHDPLDLFIERIVDAIGNETKVLDFNYRMLSPVRMQDANDNISAIIADELGLAKVVSVEGKDNNNDKTGEEGDNLIGFTEATGDAEQDNIDAFLAEAGRKGICNYGQLQAIARELLLNAGARMVYDFSRQPTVVATITREQHASINPDSSPLQICFEYSDGFGRVAMKKMQAEPGSAKQALLQADGSWKFEDTDTGNQLRWVGNGRTVFNNKGNAVKQYEPYFSVTPAYEDAAALVESGVTTITFYDAAERIVKTVMPNGTFSEIEFNPWNQIAFDTNDTVKDSIWYSNRITLEDKNREKKAALKAATHHGTPSRVIFDTLGRSILSIDHNKYEHTDGQNREEFYYTFTALDIEGNVVSVTDPRGNTVMRYRYDMLGHIAVQVSMDAGTRWLLNNAYGNLSKSWDERKHEFSYGYDPLHRVVSKFVKGGEDPKPLDILYEKITYGDNLPGAKKNNLRGRVAVLYDTAGKLISEQFDFKGNLLKGTRIFSKNFKEAPDWNIQNPDDQLEKGKYSFTTLSEYDAINRPISQKTPDNHITSAIFNPAGLLESVNLKQGNKVTSFVKRIDYNARGQRLKIEYGNNVSTFYTYEPETFRLSGLRTTRNQGDVLQDIHYTYDPVGNITQIDNKAIPTVFFNNQKIAGSNEFGYDSLYRLLTANGREQNTNSSNFSDEDNWNDAYSMITHNSNDPMSMRSYTQRYQYDYAGNILKMSHEAGSTGSWTRDFSYESKNNRLKSVMAGNNTYQYTHHPQHGLMVTMPHLQMMKWNFRDELQATSRQKRTDGGEPETTYFIYDGNGKRVRKVTANQSDKNKSPVIKDERIYFDAYEVYINENGLKRDTLHIMDDRQRIAMLETETEGRKLLGIPAGRTSPSTTCRYQLGNHLGSVNLELNELAEIINYEEYHPFGTTAYQAKSAKIKAAAKRYRYIGMERDEETGLEYHTARYYAPWLGRWISYDPIGTADGLNIYTYVANNPIYLVDTDGKQMVCAKGASCTRDDLIRLYGKERVEEEDRKNEAFEKEHPEIRFAREHPIATEIIEGIQFAGAVIFLVQDIRSLSNGLQIRRYSAPRPSAPVSAPPAPKPVATAPPAPPQLTAPPAPKQLTGSPAPPQLTGSPAPKQLTGPPAAKQLTGSPAPKQLTSGSAAPKTLTSGSSAPGASSTSNSQTNTSGGRGTWDLSPADRGRVLESKTPLPGKRINGNFSDFDRVVHDPSGNDAPALEVGQTKSIDTKSKGYTYNPRRIYNTLMKKIGEVAAIGEGIWSESGHKVVVGTQTKRVFDVIIPPEPLTAEQALQLELLKIDSASIGVEVRVHIMH